jgi:DNA-binding PadR family transcriptional regulator
VANEDIPLKPAQHLILLILAEEPTYGVELLERLDASSQGAIQLNAGSLYRVIAQLVHDDLIEPVSSTAATRGIGAPRKLYAATEAGRDVLRAEAVRQAKMLEMARNLNLLEDA